MDKSTQPHHLHPPRNKSDWNAFIELYESTFPSWERESSDDLIALADAGSREITLLSQGKNILGFCVLDYPSKQDYALVSYVGIDPSCRGRGFGSVLVLDAITSFRSHPQRRILLIEAEDRQSKLYSRLGFMTIDLEYSVPKYNSTESQSMNLQYLMQKGDVMTLSKTVLSRCIHHIFEDGYGLDKNDPRFLAQMQAVKEGFSSPRAIDL